MNYNGFSGQEFISPTDKDKFEVQHEEGTDDYFIIFHDSSMRIKVSKDSNGDINLQLVSNVIKNDYQEKKLWGYILFKIITSL